MNKCCIITPMGQYSKYILTLSFTALVGFVTLGQLEKNVTPSIPATFTTSSFSQAALAQSSFETPPPTDLSVNIDDQNVIHLRWTAPSVADEFTLVGYFVDDGTAAAVVDTTAYTYPITLVTGTQYCFTIEAMYELNKYSEPTTEVCVVAPPYSPQGGGNNGIDGNDGQTLPDLCANITGLQNPVPAGKTRDASGNCATTQNNNNTVACTDYLYTDWGACVGGTKTRSQAGKLPANCSGTPSASLVEIQSCTISSSDTTPPVISGGSPTGSLAYNTTIVTLTVTTNEDATCKYSASQSTTYASMPRTFSSTNGGRSHTSSVTSISPGNSYTYYVRCQDASSASNKNTSDYPITFAIAAAPNNNNNYNSDDYNIWLNSQYNSYNTPVQNYYAPLYVPQTPSSVTSGTSNLQHKTAPDYIAATITKNLKVNDSGPEVLLLQRTLNLLGYYVSVSASESLGKETSKFNEQTKQALLKYQESYKESGVELTGYVDNATLLLLNKDIARLAALERSHASSTPAFDSNPPVVKKQSRISALIGSFIDRLVKSLLKLLDRS